MTLQEPPIAVWNVSDLRANAWLLVSVKMSDEFHVCATFEPGLSVNPVELIPGSGIQKLSS